MKSLSAVIPSPAADAAHETQARFRYGSYSVACETCHVPAGVLCLARRTVHSARRARAREGLTKKVLVPLLVGRSR